MPAGFSYYVYPRQRAAAYLRARLQNSSDFVFLGGDANTYVGNEFTGKTTLANVAPGESASPSFGIDDRMKVHHQRTRLYTTRSGLSASGRGPSLSSRRRWRTTTPSR